MADSKNDAWTYIIAIIIIIIISQTFSDQEDSDGSSSAVSSTLIDDTPDTNIKVINQKHIKAIAVEFIDALNDRNFTKAYELQDIQGWAPIGKFSSKKLFGGITKTEILTPASITTCINNDCSYAKVFVRYLSVDPQNDKCNSGRVFEQFFWIRSLNGTWKIKKAALKSDAYCYAG